MEGRKGEEMNSMGVSPPHIIQDSPLKLPLAPFFPTQHDRSDNPTVSTRRGISIFSPAQTLDPPHHHQNFGPPAPQINGPTPNPDPSTVASDSRKQSPPHAPPLPLPQPAASSVIRHKECQKNHAASMGGHVVDGCGEFMPSGDDGTPQALRCAACDCHRNFHRREAEGQAQASHSSHAYNLNSGSHRQTPSHHLQHKHSSSHSYPQGFATAPTMVSFGGGAAAVESSSKELNIFLSVNGAAQAKKRHRTKFRQDQKDRMHEFARKLGWRIQKHDEQKVQEFCSEVGVKRKAFKIWMYNNKQVIKKRSSPEI